MKCTECGNKISKKNQFCPSCGAVIDNSYDADNLDNQNGKNNIIRKGKKKVVVGLCLILIGVCLISSALYVKSRVYDTLSNYTIKLKNI